MKCKKFVSSILASLALAAIPGIGEATPRVSAERRFRNDGDPKVPVVGGGLASTQDILANLSEEGEKNFRYAVIAQKETTAGPWKSSLHALKAKYPQARTFAFQNDLEETLPSLRAYRPTHVAYVARPEELALDTLTHNPFTDIKAAAAAGSGKFNRLLTQFDSDPYPDAIGGIITGATPEDALQLAAAKPFTIHHALLKTLGEDENLAAFSQVTAFSDGRPEQGKVVKREKNRTGLKKTLLDVAGPEFLETLHGKPIDAVVVSCHASYRDWAMGWGYPDDRWVIGKNASLYALSPDGTISGTLNAPQPKFYWGAGNCESARIVRGKNGVESMALSWIHSGGVRHLVGYTLDTWHGFIGWNLRHALLASDRPTIANAYTQTLIAAEHERQRLAEHREKHKLPFITQNMERFPENQELGKLYDLVATTYYGDPASEVRVSSENATPLFEKSLQVDTVDGRIQYTCFLKTLRDNTFIHAPVVYRLPIPSKQLAVYGATPGLVYAFTDDAVIFETNEIITSTDLGIANHKPKSLLKNLEWKIQLRLKQTD